MIATYYSSFYTNLDIIFFASTLTLLGAKVLRVFLSRYLIAGSQEKTTCILAFTKFVLSNRRSKRSSNSKKSSKDSGG